VVSISPVWVKIGDFGLAKLARNGTVLRTQAFTRSYVASEIGITTNGDTSEYTNAVDIWSLGCVTHEMLTKALPFRSLRELFSYCNRPEFPRKAMISKSISQKGIEFVVSMLALSPEHRIAAKEALNSGWLRPENRAAAGAAAGLETEEGSARRALPEGLPPSGTVVASWGSPRGILRPTDFTPPVRKDLIFREISRRSSLPKKGSTPRSEFGRKIPASLSSPPTSQWVGNKRFRVDTHKNRPPLKPEFASLPGISLDLWADNLRDRDTFPGTKNPESAYAPPGSAEAEADFGLRTKWSTPRSIPSGLSGPPAPRNWKRHGTISGSLPFIDSEAREKPTHGTELESPTPNDLSTHRSISAGKQGEEANVGRSQDPSKKQKLHINITIGVQQLLE
jgi:serine/threonine protein kinase